jgi:hypothetical protein
VLLHLLGPHERSTTGSLRFSGATFSLRESEIQEGEAVSTQSQPVLNEDRDIFCPENYDGKKLYMRANQLRKANPQNLFCIVEFDHSGVIHEYESGKSWSGPVDLQRKSADAEERMCMDFGNLVAQHGRFPNIVRIITAASPCSRVCANKISDLATKYQDWTSVWEIAYHAPYFVDVKNGKLPEVMQTLDMAQIGKVQIFCYQIFTEFVDPSTIHKGGVKNKTYDKY